MPKRRIVIVAEFNSNYEWKNSDYQKVKDAVDDSVYGLFVTQILCCDCGKPHGTHAMGCPIRSL